MKQFFCVATYSMFIEAKTKEEAREKFIDEVESLTSEEYEITCEEEK